MKTLLTLALAIATLPSMAMKLPITINTHGAKIDYVRGEVIYVAENGICRNEIQTVESKEVTEYQVKFEVNKSLYITGPYKCGRYKLLQGNFALKIDGQDEMPFNIKPGKLLNNYSRGWGTVIWGSKVEGFCSFRDGNPLHCEAGSESTWGGVKEPFTLYVSSLYPSFKWNIEVVIRD